MKFKLDTSGHFYIDGTPEVIALRKLGFTFSENGNILGEHHIDKDLGDVTIEINSLEELVEFAKGWGELVFDGQKIEIYDDYRE